jgi:hypothetical protein
VAAGAGTVAAVVAVGLVVLGGPATELAAQVTASWTPFRSAGTPAVAMTPVPQVPQLADPYSTLDTPQVPAPAPVVAVPRPRPLDVEIVPPTVPRGIIPEFEPPPAACGAYSNPRRIAPAVEPGVGTATLSWVADSREVVRGYRVQAISQELVLGDQPAAPQQLVGQRDDCGEVSTTMTGLTSGVAYVFWVEEQVWDDAAQVARFVQVGTSPPVVVP